MIHIGWEIQCLLSAGFFLSDLFWGLWQTSLLCIVGKLAVAVGDGWQGTGERWHDTDNTRYKTYDTWHCFLLFRVFPVCWIFPPRIQVGGHVCKNGVFGYWISENTPTCLILYDTLKFDLTLWLSDRCCCFVDPSIKILSIKAWYLASTHFFYFFIYFHSLTRPPGGYFVPPPTMKYFLRKYSAPIHL